MLDSFADIEQFLHICPHDLAPATVAKLKEVLNDQTKSALLKLELAITIDAGEQFVKSTYALEGDGPLVFCTYEEINKVSVAMTTAYYPNTRSVARQLSRGNATTEQQLMDYAVACVQPGYAYFRSKFEGTGELNPLVQFFKAARVFSPINMCDMQPSTAMVDSLAAFPIFSDSTLQCNLKAELPAYVAAVEDVSPEVDNLGWWKRHESQLPHLASACRTALLVQPSSAAVERVFSLLTNSFNCRQRHCLEDCIEASVMLQYNKTSKLHC